MAPSLVTHTTPLFLEPTPYTCVVYALRSRFRAAWRLVNLREILRGSKSKSEFFVNFPGYIEIGNGNYQV